MSGLVPIRKKRGSSRPPGSTPASRFTILLEDIQGKVQLTMEAVTGFRGEIDALRSDLSRRIGILEMAIRQNSEDIRQNTAGIQKNSEDIGQLRADVRQNTQDIVQLRAEVRQNTQDIGLLRTDLRQNTQDIGQLRTDLRQNTEEIRSMRELLERKADHETLVRLEARVRLVEQRLGIQ